MPLTAKNADGDVDATVVADDVWATFYKQKPARFLTCRGCDRDVTAKVSKLGNRYFAHRKENSDCPTAGETEEHRMLKRVISLAITASGGTATIEAYPLPGDRGGWRADVIGQLNGHRTAFEVQRSPMTVQTGEFRTDRYVHDQIAACWITMRDAHWLWKFPGAKLAHNPEDDKWSVVRGHVVPGTGWRDWEPGPAVGLDRFVALVLSRRVTAHHVQSSLHEQWTSGGRERSEYHGDWFGWIRDDHLRVMRERKAAEALAARTAADRQRAGTREPGIAALQNAIPLVESRHRVWPVAVSWAQQLCGPNEHVTIGDLRVDPHDVTSKPDRLTRTAMVKGGASNAYAPPVWISGPDGHRLVAVVCPWEAAIESKVAREWRVRKVRVYVETTSEGAAARRRVGNGVWIEVTGTEPLRQSGSDKLSKMGPRRHAVR